ncbi:MAG: TlpA disulfide reductase family protein [Ignavibacteriales bacterium]|nr:TlpA disulfide reductase family protein [Ignavibacteriales bacterium]
MNIKRFLFIACVFISLGCQHHIPKQERWVGALTIGENKQIPFQFYLDLNSTAPAGYFINGTEQTSIPEILLHDDSLSFIFSEYGAAMRGIWNGKKWRGKFFRYRADTSWNEFVSTPKGSTKENNKSAISTGHPLAGKYQAYISGSNGIDSTSIANFWMKNDSIFGTLIAPDGDYGLLAGTQVGPKATLTRFTGWQAFIMELERQGTQWNGSLYARSGKPMEFTLVPQSILTLELKPEYITTMKNPKVPFTFYGTTSTGTVISSEDYSLRNKALVIDIMGTWCHNCMDAAPLLQQIYSEFGKDGLEVIGLAFEISDNPAVAKKNLALFQTRFGLTYPVLFCGSTNNANVQQKLHSQLNNFNGYPTTIFVDKKGIVKKIHVGFNGPGTGDEYQRQIQQYYETVKQLVK